MQMEFYFSQKTADKPLDGKDRVFPTQLSYIPALEQTIEYTVATNDPANAQKFKDAGYKLVAKDVDTFAVIRTFRLIGNPEAWKEYYKNEPEKFSKALAPYKLSPEILLALWNKPDTKKKREVGTVTFPPRTPETSYAPSFGGKRHIL